MARKNFKCGKCGRAFSMKAHLARHVNTKHQAGSRKPSTSNSIKAHRRAVVRSAHKIGWGSESDGTLTRIKAEMRAYRSELLGVREQLDNCIAGLECAMQAVGAGTTTKMSRLKGGRSVGPNGGRPAALKAFIFNALRSRARPMGPHEIAQAVRTAGYKTKAKDLTKAVGNALSEMKGVTRVDYGLYRA